MRPLAFEELGQGTEVRHDGLPDSRGRRGLPTTCGFAHDDADEHGRERQQRARVIRDRPVRARRDDQRERGSACGPDTPAVLVHARADAELPRLEQFDAIRVDDDVVGRRQDADENCGGRHRRQRRRRIHAPEIDDGQHHQRPRQPQPSPPLTKTTRDTGIRTVSMSGAHTHLKLKARNVNAKAVTALFLRPSCARRVVRVAAIIANPKPDDTPRKNAAIGAASTYGRTPSGSRLRQFTAALYDCRFAAPSRD